MRLVQECDRLGILVDLAHLNEKGFWDVAKTSTAPKDQAAEAASKPLSTEDAKAKFGELDIKLPYLRFAKAPA